jgi:hypothetical protein
MGFRLPPALLDELEATVPSGQRSAVIAEGLRRELARRRRAAEKQEETGGPPA